jgi:hypothetical protein
MALINRQVLVLYDVGGPDLWHERLVLHHIINDDYVVASPDNDVFYEELSVLNTDFKGLRVKPSHNVLPAGILPAQVYPLPAFSPAEIAQLRHEGQQVLQHERTQRGLGAEPRPQEAAGANDFVGGTLYWLAAENTGCYKFGDRVDGVAQVAVKGDKFVHVDASGTKVFVECVEGAERPRFLQRPSHMDHRINPVEIDASGKPECSLRDAASSSTEKELNWSLTGPRTAKWCIAYLVVENLGLEGHHERFRSLCKIESSSWGVQEHYQLSMIMKHLLQVDQYNGYNSLGIEVIFRRLQTIEFAYAERARENEAKSVGGRLALEEQQVFGGLTRQAATLMVCPQLLEHVRSEVEREASLQKNLRKSREERELARKSGKKAGKGEEAP